MTRITANRYFIIFLSAFILCTALQTSSLAQSEEWPQTSSNTLGEFTEYSPPDEFSPELSVVENDLSTQADPASDQTNAQRHRGLLGKSYFHASYSNRRYKGFWDTESSYVHGFAAELNMPIEKLRKEKFGMDFFARFEHENLKTSRFTSSGFATLLGFRSYWLLENKRFRPYTSFSVGLAGVSNIYEGRRYSDSDFAVASSLGLEVDLASQVTSRHEIDAYLTGGGLLYDGSLIFWATEQNFFRAGVEISLRGGGSRVSFGFGRSF